ncbi:hypothetical protein Godav_004149, partial [Gossypium davidsonii]|nr:hypothetical protein [Gossypium davidsonii]
TKRKWVSEEDDSLVSCLVDLHNVGTFNANTRFKADYLNELEKMLEKVLPHAMLNVKLNLESRIRTLKRDWAIIYDMLSGKNNSGFGLDEHRQLVVAEYAVWNSYINLRIISKAGQFKHRSFPYYDKFIAIYAKDRATGKDAQTGADIIEKIDIEDIATTNTHEERNDFHGCEADVSLDDMDLSATQLQQPRNQGDSTFSKKKEKIFNASYHISSTSFTDAATLLPKNIRTIGLEISRIEGLTEDERYCKLSKILDYPTQMFIFFSLPSSVQLEWVKRFLADH